MQHMAIMAELIKIEYKFEMDVDFKIPTWNNLANRIGADCIEIVEQMKKNKFVSVKNDQSDFLENYTIELQRVFKFFIGMPPEKIAELMDGWENIQKHVTEHDNLDYVTIGLTAPELEEVEKLAKRKGLSDGLKTKLEAVIQEVNKVI